MAETNRIPAFASDAWMLEQQLRAELEAEAWRRLRQEMAEPLASLAPPPAAAPAPKTIANVEVPTAPRGSAILRGIVRSLIGASGAYLAFLAAADSDLGEFEWWLAAGAGFVVALALTAFGPGRRLVAVVAQWTGWALVIACVFALIWVFTRISA